MTSTNATSTGPGHKISKGAEAMSERRQYGDQRACGTCGTDIEWHGREVGWMDRGGNTHCDTGGQAWVDQDGATHRYPHRAHRPGSSFTLPHGARRL